MTTLPGDATALDWRRKKGSLTPKTPKAQRREEGTRLESAGVHRI